MSITVHQSILKDHVTGNVCKQRYTVRRLNDGRVQLAREITVRVNGKDHQTRVTREEEHPCNHLSYFAKLARRMDRQITAKLSRRHNWRRIA